MCFKSCPGTHFSMFRMLFFFAHIFYCPFSIIYCCFLYHLQPGEFPRHVLTRHWMQIHPNFPVVAVTYTTSQCLNRRQHSSKFIPSSFHIVHISSLSLQALFGLSQEAYNYYLAYKCGKKWPGPPLTVTALYEYWARKMTVTWPGGDLVKLMLLLASCNIP